jgi:3alpha(or 20beta)-hydroxysteroid dehydrogenase
MTGLDLTGRRALVTGAAQGLGEGMAAALAAAGARVAVADVQDDLGAKVAATLGDEHLFVHLDVTDDDGWSSAIGATVDRFGGLDILVNNAGIEITSLLVDLDPAQVRAQFDVNVLIINVASVAATIAFPGIAVYSATKSAVDRLTRVAAMESGKLGYGVRVNCIYPGLVPTAMGAGLANDVAEIGLFGSAQEAVEAVVALTPSGRLGEVSDMADVVVFLASDAARFITGAGLPVDGGMGM